jgi:hypothetical protein
LFYPLESEIEAEPGHKVRIAAAHTRHDVRIWEED